MGGFTMDDIIKRIVAVDKACQERVNKANAKKTSATKHVNTLKETIYQDYMSKQQSTIDEQITKLKNQNQQVFDTTKKQYQDTLQQLKQQYLDNKDSWVNMIVERCIKL